VLRAPHASAGGQGLRIVASVADDFGWSTTNSGKFVWAELVIDAGPTRPSAPAIVHPAGCDPSA
jgi:hypothetical protein